jgi:hypothetical protein
MAAPSRAPSTLPTTIGARAPWPSSSARRTMRRCFPSSP